MKRPELEQHWRAVLRQVEPPAGFREQLHRNLTLQLQSPRAPAWRPRQRWSVAAGGAAVVLVLGLWLAGTPDTPSVIAAAHAHASEERSVYAIDLTYGQWLSEAGLPALPAGSRLVMAKQCIVAGQAARHLRVAVSDSAQADVFITGSQDTAQQTMQGEVGGRSWWWQPRRDLAVLVLFDPDVEEKQQRQWMQQLTRS